MRSDAAHPARPRSALLGALVVACTVVGVACSSSPAGPAPAPAGTSGGSVIAGSTATSGVLRVAAVGLDTLDPADLPITNPSAMVVADALYDPLTAIDPTTGGAVPAIAASWRADEALTTWTFTIRDDARFSDGSPVGARDAVLSLARQAHKGRASVTGARLAVIEGVDEYAAGKAMVPSGLVATDDRTVRITTTEPFAGLPELLASPAFGVVPEKVVNARGASFGSDPVGSGPFAVTGRQGDTTVLETAPGRTTAARQMELVAFDDETAAYEALRAGRLDWAPLPAGKADEAHRELGSRVQVRASASSVFLAMNTQAPALADPRRRAAIASAVDRAAVAAVASLVPSSSVVPPGLPGVGDRGDRCGAPCVHDPEAARRSLGASGDPAAATPLRLTYYDDPDDRLQARIAEEVAGDLRAVGLTVTLDPRPFTEMRSYVLGPDAQLFVYGWVGASPDPDAYVAPLFAGGGAGNVSRLADPDVDAALRRARSTTEWGARLAAYDEMERLAMAEVPVVPFGALAVGVVLGPGVRGVTTQPDGTFDVTTAAVG